MLIGSVLMIVAYLCLLLLKDVASVGVIILLTVVAFIGSCSMLAGAVMLNRAWKKARK